MIKPIKLPYWIGYKNNTKKFPYFPSAENNTIITIHLIQAITQSPHCSIPQKLLTSQPQFYLHMQKPIHAKINNHDQIPEEKCVHKTEEETCTLAQTLYPFSTCRNAWSSRKQNPTSTELHKNPQTISWSQMYKTHIDNQHPRKTNSRHHSKEPTKKHRKGNKQKNPIIQLPLLVSWILGEEDGFFFSKEERGVPGLQEVCLKQQSRAAPVTLPAPPKSYGLLWC